MSTTTDKAAPVTGADGRLDADTCDRLIAQFADRLERLMRDAADIRSEFEELCDLHRRPGGRG